ncbi:MAG: alpha-amylase family glycosyl hydrolase [Rikenellaceae bacterium]
MKNLAIYQILIDRFWGDISLPQSENMFMGGNIQGVISKLEYIQNMGFNTIYLSPFNTTTNYHGYHIEDYFAVDPHFGTTEDIVELIDKAHKMGLKLMMDFVPNHCSVEHPLFKEAISDPKSRYREWFYIEDDGSYKMFLDFDILPKFNLQNRECADYLISSCKYWCELGFDYVRVDHAIGTPFEFLKRLTREVKEVNSSIKVYGEIWAQGLKRKFFNTVYLKSRVKKYIFGIDQETIQMDYIDVIDGLLDFKFAEIIRKGIMRGDMKALRSALSKHFAKYPANFDLILMLDNHDTNRFLFEAGQDRKKLLAAIKVMVEQNHSYSIYYGTESAMSNSEDIFRGVDYADLQVRLPLQFSEPQLMGEISKIVRKE